MQYPPEEISRSKETDWEGGGGVAIEWNGTWRDVEWHIFVSMQFQCKDVDTFKKLFLCHV